MVAAVRATTRAGLEDAWREATKAGEWTARDAAWCAALTARLDDVDAVAMNELVGALASSNYTRKGAKR
jgi:hypothetical protein